MNQDRPFGLPSRGASAIPRPRVLDAPLSVGYRELSGRRSLLRHPRGRSPMTQTELDGFRRQLLALRDRLDGDITHLTDEAMHTADQAGGNLSHVPLHMADLGTDN